ncbi:hypothetical protein [Actinopolymorpha pittospori]|uniref:Uncharacterized protein n=1 Tax=Actinopolymorpha pittospori TaxID=648752 RepID=A0A927N2D8_9ACTN|nr:hypothetical protein [Actinopolymorpha pittospori]MBE1609698.1 hypothetical protein [Actinopolymorpha pittospori]
MSNRAGLTVRAASDRTRPHRASLSRTGLVPFAAALLCALVAAGCAGPTDSTPSASPNATGAAPTPTPKPASAAFCAQARKLQTSLGALGKIDIRDTGVDGVEDKVKQVRTDLDGLESAASAGWKPEINALSSALTGLGTAVEELGESESSGTSSASPSMDGIAPAAVRVATSAEALRSTITASCPKR